MCSGLTCLVLFQLKSNPSDKEEREAQNQLRKADEIQRLLAQARDRYNSQDCGTAAALLDAVIEVKTRLSFELPFLDMLSVSRFLQPMGSFVLATDLCLGRGLPRDESRVLHRNGGTGEGHQRP